jgi:uncharacterized membrane protein YkvA (DUF1232 family)
MSDLTARCLDTFPTWLKTLATDVNELSALLREEGLSDAQRRHVAGSINYLFKSLDLIPDGIEDLGYIDDAFVLRVAASLAHAEKKLPEGSTGSRLAGEARLVADFLDADYGRLEAYVKGLSKGAARGRTVDDIVTKGEVLDGLLSEVAGWVAAYEAPTFTREERTLVKLRSFLDTKLPR